MRATCDSLPADFGAYGLHQILAVRALNATQGC